MAKQKEIKTGFQETLDALEKKYGLNKSPLEELTIVSTGSLQLDEAMHIGGTALGKMVEIFGPNSSGKSTICLHQMVEYQKAFPDKRVALFDYENSFDLKYAEALGVDTDKLLIYQPDNQEMGYNMILALIDKELVSCIVIDSQTAAPPKAVVESNMEDATIALQARNNSKFCLKAKGLLSIHKTTLFIISQTRNNIGSMMGEPTITSGGEAIKFYSDIRWKIWKLNDKLNEQNKTTVDVVKSKVGKPFGQAKFNIIWGKGISKEHEVLDYAVEFDIIKKVGTWYSYQESNIGQGVENTITILKDNPELYEEIRNKVINRLKNPNNVEEVLQQL